MHKTVKNSTNLHGFTLIEIVLVMAIMLILVSVVYATFYIVNSSHVQVVVINDAKDYAYLNMAVIENDIVNANGIILSNTNSLIADEAGYSSLYFANGVLMRATSASTAAVFSYPQYSVTTASGPKPKWGVTATYTRNADKTLKVNLKIIDNANTTVYYTLEKDIVLLNISDITKIENPSGSVVKYINFVQP